MKANKKFETKGKNIIFAMNDVSFEFSFPDDYIHARFDCYVK